MSVLVIGATGTVGGQVVRALADRGVATRALVRSPERAARVLPPSVERVPGDVRDRASLERALAGVDAVFYASPHEPDEETLAASLIDATTTARARLVFLGVHADGASALTRWLGRMVFGAMMPHYRPKLRLAERIRSAGAIILTATNFFQNDELFRESILGGELVTPLSARGVNRVDVRDIGDAAARALVDPSIAPGGHPVVGAESLSGEACAAIWSRTLGRPVRYTGGDPARFEREAKTVLEGKKLDDVLASYRVLGRMHVPTDAREVARTTALLGRAPRRYEDYARDAAARWGAATIADDPPSALQRASMP